MPRPLLKVVFSDLHANSSVAGCPPIVRLKDGGQYHASKLQSWLYKDVWQAGWKKVADLRKQHKADLWVTSAGDAVDGIGHHGTIQSVGFETESETYILHELCKAFMDLKPERVFVVRGTHSHVGNSSEEALGKYLKAEREPQHGNWSSHIWRIDCRQTLVDIRHHGRVGGRPWTKLGSVGNLSSHIAAESVEAGWEVPRLAIRAHRHVYVDSGPHSVPRVIALPPLQAKTDYAEMRAPEDIPTFGFVMILFQQGKPPDVYPHLVRPDPPRTWRAP